MYNKDIADINDKQVPILYKALGLIVEAKRVGVRGLYRGSVTPINTEDEFTEGNEHYGGYREELYKAAMFANQWLLNNNVINKEGKIYYDELMQRLYNCETCYS